MLAESREDNPRLASAMRMGHNTRDDYRDAARASLVEG